MERRAASVLLLWTALALLAVPVYPHFVSPNELTRWATAAALVERGTFEVTPESRLLGPRFEDLSIKDGRTYSNKAPGAALVALPGYLAVRPFVGPPSGAQIRGAVFAMRLAAATLPVLLLGVVFARLASCANVPPPRAAVALGALLFATPLLAYGLLLFAHALVAACLFGAWALLFAAPRGPEGARPARDLGAGALLGLAAVSEYPAAVPGLVLAALAVAAPPAPGTTRRARGARLLAGGAPFVLGLALYDALLFGSPFALSSGFEKNASFQGLATAGAFGVALPRPELLARLLFDPARGLFLFSPVLLLGVAGLVRPQGARAALGPWAAAALLLTPLSILLLYGGYPNWHGGWTAGARYLVSALPFLAAGLLFSEMLERPAGLVLLGASTGAVALTSLVFPFVPEAFPFPWASFSWPLLRDGLVVPNAFHLVARPAALAFPFLVVAAALGVVVRGKRLAAVALGVALWVGGAALLPAVRRPSPALVLQRAYVADVFFDRPGALERAFPAGTRLPPPILARRDADRLLPPGPWPF